VIPFYYEQAGIQHTLVFLSMSVWIFGTWLAGQTVQGWTSVMLLFLLIASLQTFAIAVIGKCVEKIYFETNARPPISWKRKSASFRPCLRAKMCAIAQRQRRLREMAIRV